MTKVVDWDELQKDYHPGLMSLREIGKKYGCTEGAIRKKAKREGWPRDLSAKIESKAAELVRNEEVRNSVRKATEADVINANAVTSANIQIAERREVTKIKSIAMRLCDELEDMVEDVEGHVKLAEILASNNSDAMQRRFNKVADFSGRVDNMKKLSDTMNTLVTLERKVYKIDTDTAQGGVEDFLKKFRNV